MAFASWQRYCTACSSGHQPNFAALNRGRHLCSAGRHHVGHWPTFLVVFVVVVVVDVVVMVVVIVIII